MNPPGRRGVRHFFSELKRRHVIRVVASYIIAAWVIIQVAETTFPYLGVPAWVITLVIVLAVAGIPTAAILSWIFDITPSGIRETLPLPADNPLDGNGPAPPGGPSASPGAARLPVPTGSLIGREAELTDGAALLVRPDTRLLTLTGAAGTGKTRLALEIGALAAPSFRDGSRWVPLGAVTEPELVLSAVGQAFGVGEAGTQGVLARLCELLAPREILLVLDNFEHVLAAAPQLAELLAACPGLKMLVTSRAALRVRGEREFPIGTLPAPPLDAPPERIGAAPAVQLFAERAGDVDPAFELTRDNLLAVAGICARLDGLPLAIELAAVRVKVLTPAAMLARLEKRLPLLTGGGRDLPARQQTLHAAIAWSHELLNEPERRLVRRISVFAGGADLDTVEAVCGRDLEGRTLDILQSLADQSLLQRVGPPDGEIRLSMLETIREYVGERLAESGETEDIYASHLGHFIDIAEAAETTLLGPQQSETLRMLETEHDNFRTALGWSLGSGRHSQGLRLAVALWRFWEARGHLSEGRRWLDTLLGEGTGLPDKLRLKALYAAGIMADAQGDYDRAEARFRESLEANRAAGDRWGVANALNNVGVVALRRGDHEEADRLYRESLGLWEDLGNETACALAMNNLANVARLRGRIDEAHDLLEESLTRHRALEDTNGCALTLGLMGDLARTQGRALVAAELYEESLRLFREVGNTPQVARSELELGRLALETDLVTARTRSGESLRLYAELGSPRGVADSLEALARVAARGGDAERAIRLVAAAEGMRNFAGIPLPPDTHANLERALETARNAVGELRREQLRAEVRQVPQGEVVQDAIAWAGAGDLLDPV